MKKLIPLLILLIPSLAHAQHLSASFFNGGTTLKAPCSNAGTNLTESTEMAGTLQGNTTVYVPPVNACSADGDVQDYEPSQAAGESYTITFTAGSNTQCTGSAAPWSCCTGSGTGTCTQATLEYSSNAGQQIAVPAAGAGITVNGGAYLAKLRANDSTWWIATQQTNPSQTSNPAPNIPLVLQDYGTGVEADPNITTTSGFVGNHDYASLTISGAGQARFLAATGSRWAFIRVAGQCSFTTSATCTNENGSTVNDCAINGLGGNTSSAIQGIFGGAGGNGGASGSGGDGSNGANNTAIFNTNTIWRSSGATNLAAAEGILRLLPVLSEWVQVFPTSVLTEYQIGGSGGAPGGAGTGLGGQGGEGGPAVVLVCHSFGNTDGKIILAGTPGLNGLSGNGGGGGGGGGGIGIIIGPGGYPSGNLDVNGGAYGTGLSGGSNGTAGSKGAFWDCNSTTNSCGQI
jgi:hypothetical protein